MNSQLLSFVLPITLKEKVLNHKWRDAPDTACAQRFQLLLRSFLRAFDLEELDQFLIVSPATDEEEIRGMLRKVTTDTRFQVVNEHAICPELAEARKSGVVIAGWYIQQIIKLAVAKAIKTSFYLTLDSDIVCRKPFSISSLIPEGRALVNIENPRVFLNIYKESFAQNEWQIKRFWLNNSARLLGYRRKERYHYQSYGETPVLMHTQSVLDLMAHLSQRHVCWVQCLTSNLGWTEYTLFFQFLEMGDKLEGLYRRVDHNTVLDLEASVWKNSDQYKLSRDYSPKSILACRNERAGAFIAIQSYLATERWLPPEYTELSDFYADLAEQLFNQNGR